MKLIDDLPVVCEGVWLYSGVVPVKVRILSSPEMWGSGDCDDEEAVRENQKMPCYFLAYEMAGKPGEYCNLVPNLESVNLAVAYAEEKLPGIRWVRPIEN